MRVDVEVRPEAPVVCHGEQGLDERLSEEHHLPPAPAPAGMQALAGVDRCWLVVPLSRRKAAVKNHHGPSRPSLQC